MKKKTDLNWNDLRAAYRAPAAPTLDTHAIMGAVRQARAEDAGQRASLFSVTLGLPNWVYACAAALAVLCFSGTLTHSTTQASTKLTTLWESSFTPDEIAEGILVTSSRTYGDF